MQTFSEKNAKQRNNRNINKNNNKKTNKWVNNGQSLFNESDKDPFAVIVNRSLRSH